MAMPKLPPTVGLGGLRAARDLQSNASLLNDSMPRMNGWPVR